MDAIYQAIAELEASGDPGAVCTIVRSQGSTPRHVGSKMLVYADGRFIGTVGGGDLEHRVMNEAWLAIADGEARLLHYNMADPSRGDPGVCGGQVEVFVEPILPPPTVVVIGAGHVGKAVAHLAKWLGFRVAVSDDRTELCNRETIPDADAFHPCRMEELPTRMKINRRCFLVLATRGSSVDAVGMPALLETPAEYIGVIGSRRRWATTIQALQEAGVSAESIGRVHSPMGLELHAETPEEIAVSILAEILMIRDKGTGKSMKIERQEATKES
ncbi:MAG TPA: XdhC family protein [Anaerolineales bacterium]|nr:XdhC family protein [Anaerolineales bacterium]